MTYIKSKKTTNTLEIDTLSYLTDFRKELLERIDKSDRDAKAWREKREIDLENIKNRVYNSLAKLENQQDQIKRKQAEIEYKQGIMDVKLAENTTDTATIKEDLKKIQNKINNLDKFSLKQIALFIGSGVGFASGILALISTIKGLFR